jgi:c-di-GMP-binding flagellar brake protein YcgR
MSPENIFSTSRITDFVNIPGIAPQTLLLIGWDPGRYLIIQTPPLIDIGSKLFQKNHCIVRYLFAGQVYAFRCTLLSLIKEPYRLSILSYPEVIENVNLRQHERIPCIIAAEISVNEQLYEGIISDISAGGCSFELNKSNQRGFPQLKVQGETVIAMQLKEKEKATVFNTIIRSIQTDKESMMVGLKFTSSIFPETDAESAKDLEAYLQTLQND